MIETQTLPAEIPQTLSFTTTSKSSIATTILLVEDEALVRQVTADILEFHGYRVLTARNAQEATAKFHRNEGIVQLLITDVVLPGQHGSGSCLQTEIGICFPARYLRLRLSGKRLDAPGADRARYTLSAEAVFRGIIAESGRGNSAADGGEGGHLSALGISRGQHNLFRDVIERYHPLQDAAFGARPRHSVNGATGLVLTESKTAGAGNRLHSL